MESRWQPAKYLWDPAFGAGLVWSDGRNWDKFNPTNGSYEAQNPFTAVSPVAGDEAVFDPTHKDNCYIDVAATVDRLTVIAGYGSHIVVGTTLTIPSPAPESPKSNWVQLNDPTTYLRGPRVGEILPAGTGSVIMKAGSEFTWQAGRLDKLSVQVSMDAFATVRSNGINNSRRMAYSGISVDGTLDWTAGDVAVVNPGEVGGSVIDIQTSGKFNISAAGATWGSDTANEFVVSNNGLTTLDASGTVTIGGDYLTSGETKLKVGILSIKGKAEQSQGGNFILLDRTTVDVSAATGASLFILGGSLSGDGTVQGTLQLSKEGATGPNGGTVTPGVNGGWGGGNSKAGTINVSGDFKMWTSGDTVVLSVLGNGGVRKLEVAGNVQLTGSLYVSWDRYYKPGAGTTVQFMIWGGTRTGSFSAATFTFYTWDIDGVSHTPEFHYPNPIDGGSSVYAVVVTYNG